MSTYEELLERARTTGEAPDVQVLADALAAHEAAARATDTDEDYRARAAAALEEARGAHAAARASVVEDLEGMARTFKSAVSTARKKRAESLSAALEWERALGEVSRLHTALIAKAREMGEPVPGVDLNEPPAHVEDYAPDYSGAGYFLRSVYLHGKEIRHPWA